MLVAALACVGCSGEGDRVDLLLTAPRLFDTSGWSLTAALSRLRGQPLLVVVRGRIVVGG